jgi:hypothetical protein
VTAACPRKRRDQRFGRDRAAPLQEQAEHAAEDRVPAGGPALGPPGLEARVHELVGRPDGEIHRRSSLPRSGGGHRPSARASSARSATSRSGATPSSSSGAPSRLTHATGKPYALAPTTSQQFEETKPIVSLGSPAAPAPGPPH